MTTPATENNLVEFIDQRFTAIMTLPEAWGSPEAIELQVLLLVELRKVALGAQQEDGTPAANTMYSYDRFLALSVGGPPFCLAVRLQLKDTPCAADCENRKRFFELLRAFWDLEKGS
jgi:hypothetical protein